MPYIKIPFTVNITIDRYCRYDAGEDTDDIYNMLFDNEYGRECRMGEFSRIFEDVESAFDSVPHCSDIESDVQWGDIDYDAELPAGERAPHWSELVSEENIEAYRKGRRKVVMEEQINDLIYGNELDYELVEALFDMIKKYKASK